MIILLLQLNVFCRHRLCVSSKTPDASNLGPKVAGVVFELRDCLLALSDDLLLHPSDVPFLQNLKNAKLIYDECQKLRKKLNRKMRQAMVVFDPATSSCEIYIIEHSAEVVP